MSIYGIGTDLVLVSRIQKTYQSFGQKFLDRFLHEKEKQTLVRNKICHRELAKRWAIKEACMKALGQGVGQGLKMADICVTKTALGARTVRIEGVNNLKFQVSLSDEDKYVIAFVIAESFVE